MLRFGIGVHKYRSNLNFGGHWHVAAAKPLGRLHVRRNYADHMLALIAERFVTIWLPSSIFYSGEGFFQMTTHNRYVAKEKNNYTSCDLIFNFL